MYVQLHPLHNKMRLPLRVSAQLEVLARDLEKVGFEEALLEVVDGIEAGRGVGVEPDYRW